MPLTTSHEFRRHKPDGDSSFTRRADHPPERLQTSPYSEEEIDRSGIEHYIHLAHQAAQTILKLDAATIHPLEAAGYSRGLE